MAARRSSAMGGRPPANAALRGAGLIVLAVLIGVGLLAWGFAEEDGLVDSGGPGTTVPPTGVDGDTTEPTDTTLDDTTDTTEPGEILPPARPHEEVTVYVRNGSGVTGAAGRVNQRLTELNYIPRSPDNTPERVAETAIYYDDGFRAEALRVATELNMAEPAEVVQQLPVPAPHATEMGAANILVILGEDQLIGIAAG
jgi:hypothetical protein